MKLSIFRKIFCFAFAGVLAIAANIAFAEGGSSQFGIYSGLGVPDLKNTVNAQVSGVRGLAYIVPTFSLGGYYFVSGTKQSSGGIDWDFSLAGLEAAYHMPGPTGNTYVGIRYGLTKAHEDQSGTNIIYSPYHLGLTVGHAYNLTPMFSLGFEGANYGVQTGETTVGGTNYQQDAFNIITFLVFITIRL